MTGRVKLQGFKVHYSQSAMPRGPCSLNQNFYFFIFAAAVQGGHIHVPTGSLFRPTQPQWNHSYGQASLSHATMSPKLTLWQVQYFRSSAPSSSSPSSISSSPSMFLPAGGVEGSSSSSADPESASLSSLSFVEVGEFLLPERFSLLRLDFPGFPFRGAPLCLLPCGATFLLVTDFWAALGPALPALAAAGVPALGVPALGVPGPIEVWRASPLGGKFPSPEFNRCLLLGPCDASRCCRFKSLGAAGAVGVETCTLGWRIGA